MLCAATIACSDTPVAPSAAPPISRQEMVGNWTGTFTVTRTVPPEASVTNVCTQSWAISSQSGNAFSGTFTLSGGAPATCQQTGTISGSVFTDGVVAALFASNTTPLLPCAIVGYTWLSGMLSGALLRAEWVEQLTCEAGPVLRRIVVEMVKAP